MYARIAHFAGIAPGRIEEQVEEMKRQSAAARAGDVPADTPAEVRTLMETVTRFLYAVDREKGTGVGISFCESQEDMRRADAAMNEMSPGDEDGRRTGPAAVYEVVLDESY